jgi:ERCC4-type nuclease
MIRLDRRAGSAELSPLFKPYGLRVELCEMEFGDISWLGLGPDRRQVAVTVERKVIDDLIQSWTSGRLSGHQLPGMARDYDYAYLMVEGKWRPGTDGEVQVWQPNGRPEDGRWQSRGVMFSAVTNYLMGLQLRAGVNVWRSASKEETAAVVAAQYRMWQQEWESHTSHLMIYSPTLMSGDPEGRRVHLTERKVSLAEDWAFRLPRIGEKTARKVAQVFKSGERLATARLDEWLKIDGVGRDTAVKVRDAILKEGV